MCQVLWWKCLVQKPHKLIKKTHFISIPINWCIYPKNRYKQIYGFSELFQNWYPHYKQKISCIQSWILDLRFSICQYVFVFVFLIFLQETFCLNVKGQNRINSNNFSHPLQGLNTSLSVCEAETIGNNYTRTTTQLILCLPQENIVLLEWKLKQYW